MWKHACAVRIKFRKGDFIDEKGEKVNRSARNPAGNMVEAFVEKTKAFKPDRKLVQYTLSYHEGIQVESDLVDVGIEYGFVGKSGAWFTILDPDTGEILQDSAGEDLKFQGKARIVERLRTDDEVFNDLMTAVHEAITYEEQ